MSQGQEALTTRTINSACNYLLHRHQTLTTSRISTSQSQKDFSPTWEHNGIAHVLMEAGWGPFPVHRIALLG
jgi:hypothetical protein